LTIDYFPKGFPLRSKVIDYLSPPTGPSRVRPPNQVGASKTCGYFNIFSNKSQEFLAVLSGDYFVVIAWLHVLDVQ